MVIWKNVRVVFFLYGFFMGTYFLKKVLRDEGVRFSHDPIHQLAPYITTNG